MYLAQWYTMLKVPLKLVSIYSSGFLNDGCILDFAAKWKTTSTFSASLSNKFQSKSFISFGI